jgi:hypothetical protein
MDINENIKVYSISYDLNYFFTNKGIVKLNDNLNEGMIKYSLKNIPLGIKMLKENIQFKYSLGLISKEDYLFSSRKFLYEMMNRINSNNGTSVLTEWEKKYSTNSKLITENFGKNNLTKIYNLGWYGVESLYIEKINNIIIQEDFWGKLWGGVKGAAKWTWNNIKDTIAKAMSCTSGQGYIDCFMEGLRTIATSILGVAVLTGASFVPPIGQISNFAIFGALLIYDLWKMVTGKEYKVSDIIVNIISLLAPAIAKGLGSLLGRVTSFFTFGKLAVTSAVLKGFVPTLANSLGVLSGFMTKTVGIFSVKLGAKWMADMSNKASTGLSKVSDEIIDGYETEKEKLETEKKQKGGESISDIDDENNDLVDDSEEDFDLMDNEIEEPQ